MTQTPTIGRIVIARNLSVAFNGATEAPAIITRAWSNSGPGRWTVNARVIVDGPSTADLWLTSRYLFDDEATAEAFYADRPHKGDYLVWPPRVGA